MNCILSIICLFFLLEKEIYRKYFQISKKLSIIYYPKSYSYSAKLGVDGCGSAIGHGFMAALMRNPCTYKLVHLKHGYFQPPQYKFSSYSNRLNEHDISSNNR